MSRRPFAVQNVTRRISAPANSYGELSVDPPVVEGYTYLGPIGVSNGLTSSLVLFSFKPAAVGFRNVDSVASSGNIALTLLYGRTGS